MSAQKASNRPHHRSNTRRRLAYALLITIVAIAANYWGILPVFRSHLMRYLGIGDARFGLLFSISSIAGLAGVLFGGQLIDRWGPRRIIRICLAGTACGMLVLALGGARFGSFAVAEAVGGLFAAPLAVAVSAYLGRLFPRHKRRVISLNLASMSLSGMVFPIVAEGLLVMAAASGSVTFAHVLHVPFLVVSLLLLGVGFCYANGSPAASAGNRSGRRWQWRDLLLPPQALLLAALIALHSLGDSVLHVWMPRFLESASFDRAAIAPGLVMSGYALAYLLARAALAALPDRVGRRAFLILPGLAGGAVFIAGVLSRNYLLTAAGYVLGALCWSAEYPALVSTLMHHDGRRFGAGMAASGLMTAPALFVMMNLMGILIDRMGEDRMWLVMLFPPVGFLLVGIGGLAWWLCWDRKTGSSTSG